MSHSTKPAVILLALLVVLLPVCAAAGQEKKGEKQPKLTETILKVMEKAIPKELLSADGQWGILDSQEAGPQLVKDSRNTGQKILVEMTVSKIEVFPFPITETEALEVLKVSGTMRLVGNEPIKFRGREFFLALQPPAEFIIFPMYYKEDLQKVRTGQKITLETTIDLLSFGWLGTPLGPMTNLVVIYANPGFPQGTLKSVAK